MSVPMICAEWFWLPATTISVRIATGETARKPAISRWMASASSTENGGALTDAPPPPKPRRAPKAAPVIEPEPLKIGKPKLVAPPAHDVAFRDKAQGQLVVQEPSTSNLVTVFDPAHSRRAVAALSDSIIRAVEANSIGGLADLRRVVRAVQREVATATLGDVHAAVKELIDAKRLFPGVYNEIWKLGEKEALRDPIWIGDLGATANASKPILFLSLPRKV